MRFMLTTVIGVALYSSVSLASPSHPLEKERSSVGYFISIDGIRPDYLRTMENTDLLSEKRGLGWLYRQSARAEYATAVGSTLTAPSHVSNITCTPPAVHGIVANTFLVNDQIVSGFSHEMKAEPFWLSAKRQGKKVLSVAYVSADGSSQARSADYGIAYPDNRMIGRRAQFTIRHDSLAGARNWRLPETLCTKGCELYERRFYVLVNPTTEEKSYFNALILKANQATTVFLDDDKDLTNGFLGRITLDEHEQKSIHLFFREQTKSSPLFGYLRMSEAAFQIKDNDDIEVNLSKATYNNAYPMDYRQFLEDQRLVWPDYEVHYDEKINPMEFVDRHDRLGRFFTEVAQRTLKAYEIDAVLYYQPLIDALGHAYEALLPKPFDPARKDEITKAYVEAFRRVDFNLGRVLSASGKDDVTLLLGDHGMAPVEHGVNLHPLVGKLPHPVRTVTSGNLLLVYHDAQRQQSRKETIEAAAKLKVLLEGLSHQGKSVLGSSHSEQDYAKDEWNFGEAVWAFTVNDGFWFTYNIGQSDIFIAPSPLGMHGQIAEAPSMATAFLLKAPGIASQDIGPVNLIDALPTFSELLGITPPRDCQGKSILSELRP